MMFIGTLVIAAAVALPTARAGKCYEPVTGWVGDEQVSVLIEHKHPRISCPTCGGDGRAEIRPADTGRFVLDAHQMIPLPYFNPITVECPTCKGEGGWQSERCGGSEWLCYRRGWEPEPEVEMVWYSDGAVSAGDVLQIDDGVMVWGEMLNGGAQVPEHTHEHGGHVSVGVDDDDLQIEDVPQIDIHKDITYE